MKKVLKGLLIFIVIAAGIFYWPKSLESILEIDYEKVDQIRMHLVEPGVVLNEDEGGNEVGVPKNDVYQLEMNEASLEYNKIFSILNHTKYHSKLRNLLPFELEVSNHDFEYNGYVFFSIDDDYQWISFLGDERVMISSKEGKSKVYTMSNSKVLDEFAEYMKEHAKPIE